MLERGRKIGITDCIWVIMVGALYFCWACHLQQSWCPDEYMRDDVAFWILQNGRLPVGNEPELINPIWGFSYAFLPYLPSLIGVLLMKLCGLFTASPAALLMALRSVSVLAGAGSALFSLKIGKRVFHNRLSDYVFSAFICLLPQFVFVSSYFNNDSFSVFTTVVMLYFWVCGLQDGWNVRNSIGLGIGIGCCALTYYNAYGFILGSVVFYFLSWAARGEKSKPGNVLKYFLIILGTAFAVAGWYFIRNYFIYDGDFLGMRAMRYCGELNAADAYKPSSIQTRQEMGVNFWDMLTDAYWFRNTLHSFIGCFGYMNVWISLKLVRVYYLVLGGGAAVGLVLLSGKKRTRPLSLCLLMTIVLPVLLSLYNSYTTDYQMQGRYLLSALPGLAFLAVSCYDRIVAKVRKWMQNLFLGVILVGWILLFARVWFTTILPECWAQAIEQILL